MAINAGLSRIATVLKALGLVLVGLGVLAAVMRSFVGGLVMGVPGAGLWLAGWIVQGFVKPH